MAFITSFLMWVVVWDWPPGAQHATVVGFATSSHAAVPFRRISICCRRQHAARDRPAGVWERQYRYVSLSPVGEQAAGWGCTLTSPRPRPRTRFRP